MTTPDTTCAVCLSLPCRASDGWERDKHAQLTLALRRDIAARAAGERAGLTDDARARATLASRSEALRECTHCGRTHPDAWRAYVCARNAMRKSLRRTDPARQQTTAGWRVYRAKDGVVTPIAPRKAVDSGVRASATARVTYPAPCPWGDLDAGCCGEACGSHCGCECHEYDGPACGACAGTVGITHASESQSNAVADNVCATSTRTAVSISTLPGPVYNAATDREMPRRSRGGKGATRSQRGSNALRKLMG